MCWTDARCFPFASLVELWQEERNQVLPRGRDKLECFQPGYVSLTWPEAGTCAARFRPSVVLEYYPVD